MTDTERNQIERLDTRVQALDDKVDELREDRARADEIRRQQGEADRPTFSAISARRAFCSALSGTAAGSALARRSMASS